VCMQVFSARVQNGTILLDESIELVEGSRVIVVADEKDTSFKLSPQQEAELSEAIAEVERGDVISADELFRRLNRNSRANRR